ncbi:hypothetical protein C8R43DRAFT_313594 [Mycena crocata]|nr:hypothetical protein C8R43DRAFT_313594 [Mycena crocata]
MLEFSRFFQPIRVSILFPSFLSFLNIVVVSGAIPATTWIRIKRSNLAVNPIRIRSRLSSVRTVSLAIPLAIILTHNQLDPHFTNSVSFKSNEIQSIATFH